MARRILSDAQFAKVKARTREWQLVCPDGHAQDVWDAGGIRIASAGSQIERSNKSMLSRCPDCGRLRWREYRRADA